MMRQSFVKAAVFTGGIFYALSGAALLLAPAWFYENIGNFPPYNRHFLGDVGAFLLPLGLALLVAYRNPPRHRLLIGFAALGSLVHAVNHVYDDLMGTGPSGALLTQTLPLFFFAAILALAWYFARASGSQPAP